MMLSSLDFEQQIHSRLPTPDSPHFPPDAFTLSSDLRSAFGKLPDSRLPTPHSLSLSLFPFPEFAESALRDYAGRTVEESLQAVRELSGLPLPEKKPEKKEKGHEFSDNDSIVLGRSFWAALVRGGYQGALYYVDRLTMERKES
jgi:hypothetical protein